MQDRAVSMSIKCCSSYTDPLSGVLQGWRLQAGENTPSLSKFLTSIDACCMKRCSGQGVVHVLCYTSRLARI